MNKGYAIGVFDSGLGGLTAVKELRHLLPNEDIIYFGDTGRVPYGTRSTETIVQYAKQDIAFLLSKNVKMIIAACGTVSSTLPKEISDNLTVPYMGVVQSAAIAAVKATKTGKIGVIGTQATIKSNSYTKAVISLLPDAQITSTACPLFVPLVENGYFEKGNPVTTLVAKDYLSACKKANVDTLILGCTHYPLIYDIIKQEMGEDVALISPGKESAISAQKYLNDNNLLNTSGGEATYFVSDSTDSFTQLSEWCLGEYKGGTVNQVSVEGYVLQENTK